MRPDRASRILRIIADRIASVRAPSRRSIQKDLTHLKWAIAGNRSSARYLASRFLRRASDMDALREIDQVFSNANVYPPVMKKDPASGGYVGDIGNGIELSLQVKGDRLVDITVGGKPCRDLSEAVAVYMAMKDGGASESPGADRDGDEGTVKCDGCGKEFNVWDEGGSCPGCGMDHVQCPGCDQFYDMKRNISDHCPLCGYSSWGDEDELPEDDPGTNPVP